MSTKSRCLIALICLGLLDAVIPIPILGATLIYVLLTRPPWFRDVVKEIYDTTERLEEKRDLP